MKSIKINKNGISLTYKTSERATYSYNNLPVYDQKDCCLEGDTLFYDLSDTNISLYYPLVRLLRRTFYKMDVPYEEYVGDVCDKYRGRFNCNIGGNNRLFRITPLCSDGTLGILNYGVHQYTNFISFTLTREGDFVFLSDRCHVGDYDEHHQISFEGYFEDGTILIEFCNLQF